MEEGGFWDTMKILVGKEFQRNVMDDIQDWVEKIMPKRAVSVHEEDEERKSAWNRRMSDDEDDDVPFITKEELLKFKRSLNLPKIECKFVHPAIRLRLERLMGTQITNLTDREFMLKYQEKLLEDYANKLEKRCKEREFGELERIKNLVLNEIIPISAAPKEMADHPVMLIDAYCSKLIAARRALIKVPKVKIPTFLYWDDTPDTEGKLRIERGHVFRGEKEKLCLGAEKYQTYTETDEQLYSMTDEEYSKAVYEDKLVKQLMSCENVDRLYSLASKIIGALRVVDETMQKFYEDPGSDQLQPYTLCSD